jgi:[ribosomal protein S5]-alanine N-acetyltransferase
MAFLRSGLIPEGAQSLEGRGVWLRPPHMNDYAAWAQLRALSREHLKPWEPLWPRDELTRGSYRRRLRHYQREMREDLGYSYFIFNREDDLLGGISLSNVRRGVTQSASLGYWLGLPFVRRGHMSAAVQALLPHACHALKLHRIEAASQPDNTASMRVLERCGFVSEGHARKYLKINGEWQDHVLYAFLAADLKMGGVTT